jgi:hypothetical protein
MSYSKISFTVPTTNTDGSAITEALSYTALIDTVNPPVKGYPVPATAVPVGGVVTATFSQIGFAPVNGTTYYATATATDASGTSGDGNIVVFTYTVVPNPPTGFIVA